MRFWDGGYENKTHHIQAKPVLFNVHLGPFLPLRRIREVHPLLLAMRVFGYLEPPCCEVSCWGCVLGHECIGERWERNECVGYCWHPTSAIIVPPEMFLHFIAMSSGAGVGQLVTTICTNIPVLITYSSGSDPTCPYLLSYTCDTMHKHIA